jgi:RHS repeat-associated protein
VVNAQGGPVECVDYLPFGGLAPRSGTGCFGETQAVTQLFTGKERDGETGLDYFGARYFSAAQGRFTSADDFFKDSHVADPQSWNKYAYTRNNPLRYVDPTGENATVTASCSTNDQNQTTCNVNITATIGIYAADSGVSNADLNRVARTFSTAIDMAWTGSAQQDGVTYNVSTDVKISVFDSQSKAMNSGEQNVLGITSGPLDPSHPDLHGFVAPKSLGRALAGGPDVGMIEAGALGDIAHEFTHMLGVDDRSTPGYLSTTFGAKRPLSATNSDFGWGLKEVVQDVNRMLSKRDHPASFSVKESVGAPMFWWK